LIRKSCTRTSKGDGIIKETLGGETLVTRLAELTLDIEATAEEGFEANIGVVRDNARQLKFKPESTGFED
jgi:hypothetical protein